MSMDFAKPQCYEFECFEDNYSLTISTQGCRINTRKINTKKTYSLQRVKVARLDFFGGIPPKFEH